MPHLEERFSGVRDAEIYWQAWLPDSEPRAAVVISHGVSEHSDRYAHVARALNDAGYAAYAHDHRGHGRSGGGGSNIERLDYVVADLLTLVQIAADRQGEKPFLLGHSMGGNIATAFVIEHEEELAGLILSSPAVDAAAATPVERVLSRVASELAPRLGVFDVEADGISRDPEVVRAYVADPLVHNGKMPARTVSELVRGARRYPGQLPAVRLPVLIFHGGADPIVPVRASEMVEDRIGSEDKTAIYYDGLYHETLNEPEQDKVIAAVVAWLDARVDRPLGKG